MDKLPTDVLEIPSKQLKGVSYLSPSHLLMTSHLVLSIALMGVTGANREKE